MASAGLRLNALPLLRMNDLIEITKYNIYQIRVYSNSRKDRYHTFCTPEAKKAIDNYLDYRRHEFDRTDIFQIANNVKPLSKFSIKKAIHQILYISGLRTPLVAGQNNNKVLNVRRRTAMNHGFINSLKHDVFIAA
jgi:site-specific recombinase XerC